mmetsp:Transcript_126/g.254  ORF Transcript_126/g.254 Transcript_126/m.254 type:complete len:287 (-) Transcript_126:190-1050(-)
MSTTNIINSGAQSVGSTSILGRSTKPRYDYQTTYDSSVVSDKSQAKVVILFVVGTAMSCTGYAGLAANCVAGQSTMFVTVDNSPGSIVKLSGEKTAEAFNDIQANIKERLGDIVSPSATIFVGGHSAGGYSAIEAMQENGGDLSFKPAGYMGCDPLGRGAGVPALKIECPTFAMGFTIQTCGVTLDQAGLAAYNITSNSNRVMMQMINLRNFGNQITHCIFASDGCPACPSHDAGAWVRDVIGKFSTLFVDSVVKGKEATKNQYEAATGDKASLVNVFFGAEPATV